MRKLIFLFCLFSLLAGFVSAQGTTVPAAGQSAEFEVFDNGYVYSPQAMTQLHGIVDSLNLRFKSCDLHPRLPALAQARGHYLYSEKPSPALLKALEASAPFEEVLALCTTPEVVRDLLVVRDTEEGKAEGDTIAWFFSPQILREGEHYHNRVGRKATAENQRPDMQGRWFYVDTEKYWEGFYLSTDFQQPVLPETYGRMIRYVDCLIDTSTTIWLNDAELEAPWSKKLPAIAAFVEQVYSHPPRPFPKDSVVWPGEPGYAEYDTIWNNWEEQNRRWLRDTFSRTTEFAALLEAAQLEVETQKATTEIFETALTDAGLGSKALELKRRRHVWGRCSQDDSPRRHARSIAELAAETVQWDIFLRAHLNIMNDRFDRMSDGSYAWGQRGTYIREVEALGINTLDLLLGTCLQSAGLPENHYFGSISRIGRALAEYSDPAELENRLAGMIADPQLDDFNRLWTYNLFAIYLSYLPDGDHKTATADRLKQAGQTLPAYLAEKL